MILSNEPGYYKAGAYGIRTENLVLVVAGRQPTGSEKQLLAFETLTLTPIDRRLILPDLMNEEEINWLNDYHARVVAQIGPLVDPATRLWLEKATTPLDK